MELAFFTHLGWTLFWLGRVIKLNTVRNEDNTTTASHGLLFLNEYIEFELRMPISPY